MGTATRPAKTTRRTVLRAATASVAFPFASGCLAPGEATTDESPGETGEWRRTVAVGPDGRPVFEPGTESPMRVQPGTTVAFEWKSDGHDVHVGRQPDDAAWTGHEATADTGFAVEHTFDVTGRYRFWCSQHRENGMVGELIVGSCDCGPQS